MALLGLPAPFLWGLFTVLAEFIPYAGGFVMVTLLALTGLAGGGGLGHALIAPLLYLLITTLQNNLVSPVVYGRGLKLNPAAILIAVMVWFFLWGVPGAFLAVPLLAATKVLCDHIDGLSGLGSFLEG
jgi:predicted PurR-regulated permease PerM